MKLYTYYYYANNYRRYGYNPPVLTSRVKIKQIKLRSHQSKSTYFVFLNLEVYLLAAMMFRECDDPTLLNRVVEWGGLVNHEVSD